MYLVGLRPISQFGPLDGGCLHLHAMLPMGLHDAVMNLYGPLGGEGLPNRRRTKRMQNTLMKLSYCEE